MIMLSKQAIVIRASIKIHLIQRKSTSSKRKKITPKENEMEDSKKLIKKHPQLLQKKKTPSRIGLKKNKDMQEARDYNYLKNKLVN